MKPFYCCRITWQIVLLAENILQLRLIAVNVQRCIALQNNISLTPSAGGGNAGITGKYTESSGRSTTRRIAIGSL